jgi:hypothetical protein
LPSMAVLISCAGNLSYHPQPAGMKLKTNKRTGLNLTPRQSFVDSLTKRREDTIVFLLQSI